MWEPYKSRREEHGVQLYGALGVARDDAEGRLEQYKRNFEFFNAPVALFIAIDRKLGPGQWADLGGYIHALAFLARGYGLDTCPQESWARMHRIVGEFVEHAAGTDAVLRRGDRLRRPRPSGEQFSLAARGGRRVLQVFWISNEPFALSLSPRAGRGRWGEGAFAAALSVSHSLIAARATRPLPASGAGGSPRSIRRYALLIQIPRHALPRRALRRADIARRGREDVLPRPPLLRMRHAIERAAQAASRFAAAAALPAARLARAGPPQGERVAIAALLQRLLDREAPRVFDRA